MTREEEIRKASIEANADIAVRPGTQILRECCRLSFQQGAKWADANPKSSWINIKDDLPCNHQELTHSNYTDRVLVLSRNGYSEVAFMCIIEGVWEWNTLIKVLYWMPIPKLPKE